MFLTYDLVAARDPFVLIRDGMQSGIVQSYARALDRKDGGEDRARMAQTILAAALEVHPHEITILRTSSNPCNLDIRKALSGALVSIENVIYDLPHKLWDALLIELGNGRDARALTILQVHNNTVKNIIHSVEPDHDEDDLYDHAIASAVAD